LSSESAKKASKTPSETYVGFIDILFAVVIGQSFVLLIDKEYYANWFNNIPANAFGLATLLLVYGLVISSWVGYHQSVKKYELRSIWRFLIDVILLFLYYVAFANANNFDIILGILIASFVSYSVWDLLRVIEYLESPRRDLLIRLGYSVGFAIIFSVILALYLWIYPQVVEIKYFFLPVAVVFLIVYRKIKWYNH